MLYTKATDLIPLHKMTSGPLTPVVTVQKCDSLEKQLGATSLSAPCIQFLVTSHRWWWRIKVLSSRMETDSMEGFFSEEIRVVQAVVVLKYYLAL